MTCYVHLDAEGYPLTDDQEFETLEEAQDYARELLAGLSISIEDEKGETY